MRKKLYSFFTNKNPRSLVVILITRVISQYAFFFPPDIIHDIFPKKKKKGTLDESFTISLW